MFEPSCGQVFVAVVGWLEEEEQAKRQLLREAHGEEEGEEGEEDDTTTASTTEGAPSPGSEVRARASPLSRFLSSRPSRYASSAFTTCTRLASYASTCAATSDASIVWMSSSCTIQWPRRRGQMARL